MQAEIKETERKKAAIRRKAGHLDMGDLIQELRIRAEHNAMVEAAAKATQKRKPKPRRQPESRSTTQPERRCPVGV